MEKKMNIRVNDEMGTIEITKAFANDAKYYGTEAYRTLQNVRHDYPGYRIEVKAVAKKVDYLKGLTFDFMEKYIRNNSNEEMLAAFFQLCGKTEEGEEQELAAAATYGQIKSWFLMQFPELNVKFQRDNINAILKRKIA